MILAGDVGGTKTLLQLLRGRAADLRVVLERRYEDAQFSGFDELFAKFLREAGSPGGIELAVLGVAGPVSRDRVRLTNRLWEIDAAALAARFGLGRVVLVNDFAAAASGIALLGAGDCVTLQQGRPVERAPRVVLGAGTGLGVAYLVWHGEGYEVVAGEGGNTGFAPMNSEQMDLWRSIHERRGRVIVEDVVSGPGLAAVYAFLRARHPEGESPALADDLKAGDAAAAIARHALERGDALACRALDLFLEVYGAAAGDHALAVLARGGVYVAGGIAPRIAERVRRGGFVAAFNAKGRYAELMAEIPLYLVKNEKLGLLGATALALRASARN